jgi:thiol:disulfide interchange protein DsbD
MKYFNLIFIVCWLILAFACPWLTALEATPVRAVYTDIELISEQTSIQAGKPFWVAVWMRMDEHWHIYWKNPGDSGLTPKIQWDVPEGYQVGPIHWPIPKRLSFPPLMSYGYEGEVLFLTEIIPPEVVDQRGPVTLKANVEWLVCKIECVAGEAEVSLSLPINDRSLEASSRAAQFAETRRRWPALRTPWKITAGETSEDYRISWRTDVSIEDVYFFPERGDLLEHALPQPLTHNSRQYELSLPKSSITIEPVKTLSGILTYRQQGIQDVEGIALNVPLGPSADNKGSLSGSQQTISPWLAMIFAFMGGLILNLMPCVLPVLSIKVLKLVEQVHQDRTLAWRHGLVFSCGVVVAFWVLAGILLGLKAVGEHIGWGFQFQYSGFVVFLTVLFFAMGLNFFGVFEMGISLTHWESPPQSFSWAGSFLSGVLATVVATPCTAPFMGTAIGVALSLSPGLALMIFTFLGLGMASPFLLLSGYPQLLRFIPKPGPWMIFLKRGLGGFLMGTVVWLLWVFGLQSGVYALYLLLFGLALVAIGCWVWGRGQSLGQQSRLMYFFVTVFWIGGLGVAWTVSKGSVGQAEQREKFALSNDASMTGWLAFSPELVRDLEEQGQAFFIDFTAAWCLSCQVNDKLVFQAPEVIQAFRDRNVVLIKADWTNRDDRITEALARYGKNSIPLYVLYTGNPTSDPVVLPQVVTRQTVIEALSVIDKPERRTKK